MIKNYVEIPIVRVASHCGLLQGENTNKTEVRLYCPFCNDKSRHLYLNTMKNQFMCQKCHTSGNSVTLYAKCKGVDNRTAVKELMLPMPEMVNPVSYQGNKIVEIDQYKPNTLHERNNAYFDFLQLCDLSNAHRIGLNKRGLKDEVIDQLMIKTVPTADKATKIAKILSEHHELIGIPGFYTQDHRWRSVEQEGFFIPVCTREGFIQGMQIRMDHVIKNKYKWFSSNYMENGAKAYSWVHVAGWNGQREVIVTEGGLKATIASHLTENSCFIGVPGKNAIDRLLVTIKEMNVQMVYLAYDMDRLIKKDVADAIKRVMQLLSDAGISYRQYAWEPEFKGIDDLLLHRHLQQAS